MKTIYACIVKLGEVVQPLYLLLLRGIWGGGFIQAGWGKLQNYEQTAAFFEKIGIPFSHLLTPFVGVVELVCGALLAVGLASRLVSLPLIATMVVALMTAHQAALFALYEDFFGNMGAFLTEAPITFLMALLAIFCFGPGCLSLDGLIKRFILKRSGE